MLTFVAKTARRYYCKICKHEINFNTALYGQGMCNACANKLIATNKRIDKKYNNFEQMLKYKYNILKLSTRELATDFQCGQATILRYLKEYNIKTRNCKEATKIRMTSDVMREKLSLIKGGTGIPYEYSGYFINFSSELKTKIRKRDNHTCQICGIPQNLCDRKLDVHHIDYDKQNCDEDNLISLCRNCHIKTNGNRSFWTQHLKEQIC